MSHLWKMFYLSARFKRSISFYTVLTCPNNKFAKMQYDKVLVAKGELFCHSSNKPKHTSLPPIFSFLYVDLCALLIMILAITYTFCKRFREHTRNSQLRYIMLDFHKKSSKQAQTHTHTHNHICTSRMQLHMQPRVIAPFLNDDHQRVVNINY